MKYALAFKLGCLALGLWQAIPGQAAIVWDESTQGELSANALLPTALAMAPGSNIVLGTVGDSGSGVDRDYFTFNVPAGIQLSALILLGNTSVSGGVAFLAMQAGPQITVTPSGVGVENLLGFIHYDAGMVNQDLLPQMGLRIAPPLPAGSYSVWVQETGGVVPFGLNFVLSAVPEPGAGALLLAGLAGLAGLHGVRRRRR